MNVESPQPNQFFTLEDDKAINEALLASYEKNLARVALHSLNLLRQIAQDTGVAIAELNTQQIIQWFEKEAKIRVEQGSEATFLKW